MLRAGAQILFVILVAWSLWYIFTNLVLNLQARGLPTSFEFLQQPAGFTLLGTDFRSTQPIWKALVAGLGNTIRVSVLGILLATVLGVVVGVARLSTNWLVRKTAAGFVEALRNIPLLVLLIFLYIAVIQQLPRVSDAIEWPGMVLSNRGLWIPWLEVQEGAGAFWLVVLAGLALAVAVGVWRTRRFDATGQPHHRVAWGSAVFLAVLVIGWLVMDRPVLPTTPVLAERQVAGGYELTPEYGALLIGLVIYAAAFIAEIVRGSILSVPKGQTEAANAVGLNSFQRLRYVILPQAFRVAVPPTGNEFLNLTKNSALGIVIAFPELLRVTRIAIGNGYPASQLIVIMMLTYLVLSLILSSMTNAINRRLQLKER